MKDMVIRTHDLSKTYGGEKSVDKVNINLRRGEIYGLVGENGSGKSTLIKMILGLVLPSGGEIEIFSETGEKGLNQARSNIGSIVEAPSLFPYLSARKNLEYFRIQRGIEDKKIVDEMIDLVGLSQVGDKKFSAYSLGMKQRLGIALAIMLSPEILILDEPINGLDPSGIMELRKTLLRLNKEKGVTIFLSSHILDELAQVATSYGFINKGVLLKEISAEDLEEDCKKFLRIRVDRLEEASLVIEKDMGSLNYKVNNKGEILLYDFVDEPEKVVASFMEAGLGIKSINSEGLSLEEYYMDLIGGRKDA